MKATASVFMLALLAAGAAHAQLYKWVGPDGKVSYSDSPPPANAARVEQKDLGNGTSVSTSGLPYELAQAVRNHPVTLYAGPDCAPCDEARTFLKNRGIPYAEKSVTTSADITRLKQLSGGGTVPFLTIGRSKQNGFEAGAWSTALNSAGYPASSRLPASWRAPAVEAAAPLPKPEQKADANAARTPRAQQPSTPQSPPPAAGNAPPGFRF